MAKKTVLLFDFLATSIPYGKVGIDEDGRIRDYDKVSDLLNDSAKGNVLRADINATHSGTIVNHRVYPGLRMRDSAKTWLVPYPRPITDKHPAPLGRMIGNEPDIIGRVRSQKFHQLCSDEQLAEDWRKPGVRDQGSGFIRLGTDITDDDAIQKILSKRMLTVSSGQRISAMVCSVCNRDWISDGNACEHVPGKTYEVEVKGDSYGVDGKKTKSISVRCFLITGNLEYDHLAMVMTPAQPHARVISSVVGDSDDFEIRLPFQDFYDDQPDQATIVGLVLTDNDGDHPIILGDSPETLALMGKPRSKHTTSVPVGYSAISDKLPESISPNQDGDDMKRTLTDMELAERHVLATILIDAKIELDWDAMDVTRDELEKLAKDLDTEDYELNDDQLALLFDGDVPDEVKKDRRLTTTARKKLKGSTFCGPDRSFPVPDCAHAANAKSRLANAKLSSDQKKHVLSCVNRKAKAMKCFKKGSDSEIDVTVKVEPGAHLSGDTDPVVQKHTESTDPSKDQNAFKDMAREDLVAKIVSLKAGLKDKAQENAVLLEENVILNELLRTSLAKQIHAIRSLASRPNMPDSADAEAVKSYIDRLALKSIDYLNDALSDLVEEVSISDILRGSVPDPTLSDTKNDTKTSPDKKTGAKKAVTTSSPIQALEDRMSV